MAFISVSTVLTVNDIVMMVDHILNDTELEDSQMEAADLTLDGIVSLTIYDLSGQKIKELVHEFLSSGSYSKSNFPNLGTFLSGQCNWYKSI